jgi:diadenosine tetraphosphate (Ap4A) HIT family hydrolase
MTIPAEFHVFETEHWLVNHRMNSALPGYLMLGAKASADNLGDLGADALSSLGQVLAQSQSAMLDALKPQRVYIGRFGHSPGYPLHFHLIPIYDWVETLFWADARYRVLENFAEGPGETPVDGAELTLFVWREFCERAVPPAIKGPSVRQAIDLLREAMR